MSAMQVKNQLVFSTHFSGTIVECSHFLIVTVHKVHFETLYSHFGIMTAHIFHITLECMITGPKDDTYIFGSCVIYQFFQVNLLDTLHQIRL